MKLQDLISESTNGPGEGPLGNNHNNDERYDPATDRQVRKFGSARKTRLTLEQINKLRRIHEVRQIEIAKENEFFNRMYSPPEGGDQSMGM